MPEIPAISISRMIRHLKGDCSFSRSRRLRFIHCKDLDLAWAEVTRACKGPILQACRQPPEAPWQDLQPTGSSNSLRIIPPERLSLQMASIGDCHLKDIIIMGRSASWA